MEKINVMHELVGLQIFWSGTPTFSSGTPTFCQMGVLNSCFQNPSESSAVFFSEYNLNHTYFLDQDLQNIELDLDLNCLTLMVFLIFFPEKVDFEKHQTKKHAKLPSMQRVK